MLKFVSVACIALVLGGCASFNNLRNEVSTFGPWPAERKPASFVFERLPSQQAQPESQIVIETAARAALEAAGFRAVPDAGNAEYLMQLDARVSSNDPWIYNDPLFWRGGLRYGYGAGYGHGRFGRGWGPGWGFNGGIGYTPTFEREVVLLIRDRKTGELLYEARASNTGPGTSIEYLMPAMFEAALKDFPSAGPNPRSVTTPIARP